MAEAVCSSRELDGHIRNTLARTVVFGAILEGVVQDGLVNDAGQVVLENDPLVMPADDFSGFLHNVVTRGIGIRKGAAGQIIEDFVVKVDEGGVELRDKEIFIVAGIANKGSAVRDFQ